MAAHLRGPGHGRDGLNDLLCGDYLEASYLVPGAPAGPDWGAAFVFPMGLEKTLGVPMSLGDIDGDGFEDLATMGSVEGDQELVRVYLGSATGFSATEYAV